MILYILKFSACLSALLVFYKLFLEAESIHSFKRYYLLGTLVFSLLVPALVFTEYVTVEVNTQVTSSPIVSPVYNINVPPALEADAADIAPLLWAIYVIGVFFFTVKFLKNLSQIIKRIKNNPKVTQSPFIQVLLLQNLPPHTFFKYIFLNKEKLEAKEIPEEVLLHEETHARQKHSLDVLFIELLQIVMWFNPLIYFVRKSVKLNHEFLADQAVLKKGITTSSYQNTLLSFMSPIHQSSLSNAINYSSIKKRFTVMKSQTSKKSVFIRSLLLLPLLATLLFSFAETKISYTEKVTPSEINAFDDLDRNIDLKNKSTRIVEIAGLVLDSESLRPLEDADIFDLKGNLLAKTDARGYFKVRFDLLAEGELFFDLAIQKDNYKTLVQKEHWGNLPGKIESLFYFGLKKKASENLELSQLVTKTPDLSLKTVLSKFPPIKTSFQFEKQLAELRKNNQHVLFEIGGNFYLVNDLSYIKINSKEDPITINNSKVVRASEVNDLIKRSQITGMTPVANDKSLFAIYTIPVDHAVRPLKGATREEMNRYNQLAKKYHKQPIATRTIPLDDLQVLEMLYSRMSKKQQQAAQPFPECLPDKKVQQRGASREQMKEYNKLAKKYNNMQEERMQILLNEVERLRYLYSLMSDKQRADAEPFPDFPAMPEPPTPAAVPQIATAAEVATSPRVATSPVIATRVNTAVKAQLAASPSAPPEPEIAMVAAKASVPPPPPPPKSPLAFAKEMAEKNAEFFYNGEKIEASRALELLRESEHINLVAKHTNLKRPRVDLSDQPISVKED